MSSLAVVATVLALLGLCVAQASAVHAPPLVLQQPFAFESPVSTQVTVAASGLASDGAAWAVVLNNPGEDTSDSGFTILARAADGTTVGSVAVGGAPDTLLNRPTLTVAGQTATVVWLTYARSTVAVHARQCTLNGCGPGQIVASWRAGDALLQAEYTYPEPAVANADGHVVVVFARFGVPHPQMMWAQASGSRFGTPRSFGVSGNYDPAIVAEPNGRVFAAWFHGTGGEGPGDTAGFFPRGVSIQWSEWSPGQGFGAVAVAHTGNVEAAGELTAAATASAVTLAWLQGGDVYSEEGTIGSSVWAMSEHAGHFSPPQDVDGSAANVSLAGAGDVVALGFADDGGATPLEPTYHSAMVTTSVDGRPFGRPVELDADAGPPLVSVGGAGEVLATWFADASDTYELGSQELAIAPPGGGFAAPVALDFGAGDAVSGSYYFAGELPFYRGPSSSFPTVDQRSLIVSAVLSQPSMASATLFGTIATP
jgi:hypothetical protein